MIEKIRWPQPKIGEARSPFERGKNERPLRITFHTPALQHLLRDDTEAIDALLELSHLAQIEAIQMADGDLPKLDIATYYPSAPSLKIMVADNFGITSTSIREPSRLANIARAWVQQDDPTHPDVQTLRDELIVVAAHRRLSHDIFVTTSPRLLEHRAKGFMQDANIYKPLDAAQIVGLFLRSRSLYHYRARISFDRGLFYWVLASHRLPSIWLYRSACTQAVAGDEDDIRHLSNAVLVRCMRGLEARDAIGAKFYIPYTSPGSSDAHDTMIYHFDYLTLLLSGIFDAQALIARRVYGLKTNDMGTAFHRKGFPEALLRAGAVQLYALITGQWFKDVMTLLIKLRNNIHKATLPMVISKVGGLPEVFFLSILSKSDAAALWEAAERCGLPERWGMTRDRGAVQIEPYTFSVTLVAECFKLTDAVAKATDVIRLFPTGSVLPPLLSAPPEDGTFDEWIRRRLAVLG